LIPGEKEAFFYDFVTFMTFPIEITTCRTSKAGNRYFKDFLNEISQATL